jgi:CRISPR-associated protein Csb1
MWDSTGPKGGLGPKFERAMVSEVVGVGAEVGDLRRGVRRDPLEIRAAVAVKKSADTSWIVAAPDAKGKDIVAPSNVNHSSVPFPKQRDKKTDENTYDGVTIGYAEQTTTLSLICLRRLRFPINTAASPDTDTAARTVLAALGLCAATLAFESGMGLRSRCLLWPDGPMEWDLLERPGATPVKFSLTGDAAIKLLNDAIASAETVKVPILLKPSQELVKLVRLSQLEATKESGETA